MNTDGKEKKLKELEERRLSLPSGSIARKSVNGRTYYYHRTRVDGRRREEYIPSEEVESLRAKILEGRSIDKEILKLRKEIDTGKDEEVLSDVKTGDELERFASSTSRLKRRRGIAEVMEYLNGDTWGKVFVLYGLRRTGKTTLMSQALYLLGDEERRHSAYIKVNGRTTLSLLNRDLRKLERDGYRYIFIDEVTLLEDFIECSSLFSDIYASSGMKIVLSGTDSLGFILTEDEELYDRALTLHTTFIPFGEFSETLGISDIDEYIRYGGTMCAGGTGYNNSSVFSTERKTDAYVNSAIARNIQNSLRFYQNGGHFRSLYDLYEKNELTSAVNRVVEDMNHRFTVEVLTRDFKSSDYALAERNLLRDRTNPTDILSRLDIPAITDKLMNLLEIRNRENQSVEITGTAASEIEEYLVLLDLVYPVPIISAADTNSRRMRKIITQPGLRYAQAEALVESVMSDNLFRTIPPEDRKYITDRIITGITGRMLEDIVLLETSLAERENRVFTLQFASGEFDMVVFSPRTVTCRIYEIKHSSEQNAAQCVHLLDSGKCAVTEQLYGKITSKTVLYRGEDTSRNGIDYVNVERYLSSLDIPQLLT